MIVNVKGETRVELGTPTYTANVKIRAGVYWMALHVGRAHVVLREFSLWQRRGEPAPKGETYRFATVHDLGAISWAFGPEAGFNSALVLHEVARRPALALVAAPHPGVSKARSTTPPARRFAPAST